MSGVGEMLKEGNGVSWGLIQLSVLGRRRRRNKMLIFNLISKWTLEEREEFNELIRECLKREAEIAVNREASLKGLRRITDNLIGEMVEREGRWVPYFQ